MPPITVIIAGHKKSGRAACLRLLQPEKGIRVVGEARNGLEVITAGARLKPRILLFHLDLSKGKKINLLRALRQKSPRTRVILLTRRVSKKPILEGLSHGARGYIQEKNITIFLPKAVRLVDAGEAWVSRKMVAQIINRLAWFTVRKEGGEESDIGLKYIERKFN